MSLRVRIAIPRTCHKKSPLALLPFANIRPPGNGAKLQTLMVCARRSGIWSFPKGRRKKSENILENALRELTEETGLCREHIRLLNFTFIDERSPAKDTRTRYFVAVVNSDVEPPEQFRFNKNELSAVRYEIKTSSRRDTHIDCHYSWVNVSASSALLKPSRRKVLAAAHHTLLHRDTPVSPLLAAHPHDLLADRSTARVFDAGLLERFPLMRAKL